MGVLTGTAQIPAPVQATFDRALLRNADPKLHHARPAMKKSLSQRSGNTMIFRRLAKLPLAMTPLTEGVPPGGRQLSKSDIQCTLQQYGDFVPLTDLVQVTIQHPILRDTNKLLGKQAGETIDALNRETWAAGTSVFYGGNVASRTDLLSASHKVDTAVLERAMRYLNQQDAEPFTKMVQSSDAQGTVNIRDCFWAIISPEILFTLDTLAGFVAVEHYQGQTRTLPGEVGAYKNLRFLCTNQAKKYLGGGGSASGDVKATGGVADVHTILIFAEDAVAEVPLEGGSLQNIIKPLGSGGTADPLDQIATSGWKATRTCIRLNEAWMTRIEVTVADATP